MYWLGRHVVLMSSVEAAIMLHDIDSELDIFCGSQLVY